MEDVYRFHSESIQFLQRLYDNSFNVCVYFLACLASWIFSVNFTVCGRGQCNNLHQYGGFCLQGQNPLRQIFILEVKSSFLKCKGHTHVAASIKHKVVHSPVSPDSAWYLANCQLLYFTFSCPTLALTSLAFLWGNIICDCNKRILDGNGYLHSLWPEYPINILSLNHNAKHEFKCLSVGTMQYQSWATRRKQSYFCSWT